MQTHHLRDLYSRLELQHAEKGGALQKFDISDHNSALLSRLKNTASTNGASREVVLGQQASRSAEREIRLNLPQQRDPHTRSWRELTDLLFAFGKVTNAFPHFPKDGRAIISHWLQNKQSYPIGMSAAIRRQWLHFIAELLGKKSRRLKYEFVRSGDIPFPAPSRPKFRFADVFAGIGGFRLGLQNLGGKCVFSCEIDEHAKTTYSKNFGEIPFGDIRRFTRRLRNGESIDSLIPDHDILAAGFPCQPFSKAGISSRIANGQNTGFRCQDQGTLIFEVLKIVKVKRPQVLFLENVTNFKALDKGRSFSRLKRQIEKELGYSFFSGTLDCSSLVPQRRKRLYVVCFRDKKIKFSFPELSGPELALSLVLDQLVEDRYTISNRLWRGHIKRTSRNLARGVHFTAFKAALDKPANTLVSRYGRDGKECLIPQTGKNPRLLSPRECARLQGFPDKFLLPEYDTRAYRQFGNAVVVPIVEAIGQKLVKKIS